MSTSQTSRIHHLKDLILDLRLTTYTQYISLAFIPVFLPAPAFYNDNKKLSLSKYVALVAMLLLCSSAFSVA